MVSAGAANKKAFGIDRTTNPWSDMVGTEVIWVAGSNVAECSPITTNYIWQAREQGARIIVQDPRITPVARTCDLYLPVKPGRDAALFAGVLQLMIERDWIDHEFIARLHGRLRAGRGVLPRVDARAHRRGHRRAPTRDRPGRGVVGHGENQLPLPRARHRAPLERRPELARHDQPGPGFGTNRQAEERLRHDRRSGQRTGRTRARAEMRSTARLARHQQSGAPPLHRRGVEHRRKGAAGSGRRCLRALPQDRSRRDQGAPLDLLQPHGVAAGQHLHRALPREARVLCRDRFLPERHGVARRHRAARKPARGGRRNGHAGRRPDHQDQQGGGVPRRGSTGLAHHPGHRARRSAGRRASRSPSRARSSRSCASPARAASPTIRASPTRRSPSSSASSGPATARIPRTGAPDRRSSGHAAPLRAWQLQPGREGERPVLLPGWARAVQRRRLSAAGRRCE